MWFLLAAIAVAIVFRLTRSRRRLAVPETISAVPLPPPHGNERSAALEAASSALR